MPYLNPYIEQARHHPRILTTSEDIFHHGGAWKSFFGNEHPIHLEIGTGLGNFLSWHAQNHPHVNIIGMEIKYKRLWRTMQKCEYVGRGDIVLLKEYGERIAEIFSPSELDAVFLFFPDPWPKKRHWKNRILQKGFSSDLARVVRPGGVFRFKTDHSEYFGWGVDMIRTNDAFEIITVDEDYESDKHHSHQNSTEFEVIWRNKGRKVMYLEAMRRDIPLRNTELGHREHL